MPKYLVERRFHVTEEAMPEISRRSKRIARDQFPEVIWEHTHVTVDESGLVTTFCVYIAPSEELVRRHAKELGEHDVAAVYEIAGDVTPADFPI
jgi:uncharacterized protein DUF4242